jgi:hypothetical protein
MIIKEIVSDFYEMIKKVEDELEKFSNSENN